MRTFKSKPLTSLLLVGLLAWIAFVLVAPQIDLEDAAFRSKDSPLALHALTQHVSQENASVAAPAMKLMPTAAPAIAQEVLFFAPVADAPSIPPLILRC